LPTSNYQKRFWSKSHSTARIDYSNLNNIDFRPKKDRTKPLSEDIKEELTGGIEFVPDFDPNDNDN